MTEENRLEVEVHHSFLRELTTKNKHMYNGKIDINIMNYILMNSINILDSSKTSYS